MKIGLEREERIDAFLLTPGGYEEAQGMSSWSCGNEFVDQAVTAGETESTVIEAVLATENQLRWWRMLTYLFAPVIKT